MRNTEIIDLCSYPVQPVLKYLLQDNTTKNNIIFATDNYSVDGIPIDPKEHITVDLLRRMGKNPIQPRNVKSRAQQTDRTRKKAEVFTPVWICNKMNNYYDDEWFGRSGSFNIETDNGHSWKTCERKVSFPKGKSWQEYIDSTRIEITCGEAPFLVSRYDAADGTPIDINQRIGMLDRKLRIVSENVKTEEEWLNWTYRSFQSVYGYEYQGDNLLVARINLLNTFMDYIHAYLHRDPTEKELKDITRIICWNIWQMDGLTGMVPLLKQDAAVEQPSLFVFAGLDSEEKTCQVGIQCRIFDWRANISLEFKSIKRKKNGEKNIKTWDFCIGNCPYQESKSGTKNIDVWHYFINGANDIANVSCLIHPGRWVVPKKQMQKVRASLIDNGLVKFNYIPDSNDVFPVIRGVDGGITISYFQRGYSGCQFALLYFFLRTFFILVQMFLHDHFSQKQQNLVLA